MSELEPLVAEISTLSPLAVALVALAGLVVGIAPSSFPLISIAAVLAAGQRVPQTNERRLMGVRLAAGFALGIATVDSIVGVSFDLAGFAVLRALAELLPPASDSITLLAVATIGNTLGSVINWVLGRAFFHFSGRRWFPVSQRQLDPGSAWFRKYGVWSLLLAWFPIVGDALTVIAGTLRVRILPFVALVVATGKAIRYLAII
jgi:membrane protein YqaA with SNARE-associated domain